MIRVRIATADDRPQLIDFIHDHWSATHVFTQRPEVFTWQHLQEDGRLNMVLAERDEDSGASVLGVLGFIPLGRFDPALGDMDILLAIWKVDERNAPPGLGLRLLKFLRSELDPRMIAAIGTSEMVRPIYEVLRYRVGALHQAAIFNPGRRNAIRVAAGVPAGAFEPASVVPSGELEFVPFDADAELQATVDRVSAGRLPAKSWNYLARRFLDHPWYRYETRLVKVRGEPVAVIVWRQVEANGVHVLRVVDILGDTTWLRDAGHALQREVGLADAEYLDMMQWGIDPGVLATAGFVSVHEHPELILPNYFAPFEQRNVVIELAVKVFDDGESPVTLFRADSDQDRPNLAAEIDAIG